MNTIHSRRRWVSGAFTLGFALWALPSFAGHKDNPFQLCQDFSLKKLETLSTNDPILQNLEVSPKSLFLKYRFLEDLVHFSPDGEVDVSGGNYDNKTGDLKITLNDTGTPGSPGNSFLHFQFGYDTSNSTHRRVNSVTETLETASGSLLVGKVHFEIGDNGQSCIPDQVTTVLNTVNFSAAACQDLANYYRTNPDMKVCGDYTPGKDTPLRCEDIDRTSQVSATVKKYSLPNGVDPYRFFQVSCQDSLAQASVAAYVKQHSSQTVSAGTAPVAGQSGASAATLGTDVTPTER